MVSFLPVCQLHFMPLRIWHHFLSAINEEITNIAQLKDIFGTGSERFN
jgi:hypothetical protein